MVICEVCGVAEDKYKCPTCLLKYCTVKCFKLHKESSCGVEPETKRLRVEGEELTSEGNKIVVSVTPATEFQFDDQCLTEDQVSVEKLEALGADEQLLDRLRNPHVRALLTNLNAKMQQGCAAEAIHAAMMEPIFLEFVDRCLHVVEPEEE